MVGGMATIHRFEDILAWQKSRELSNLVDKVSGRGRFAQDSALRKQITRAAASVMDNIAEGFGRDGNKEFRQSLSQAKASVYEVRSQVYKASDRGYLEQDHYKELLALTKRTEQLIGGFMRYLQISPLKGHKLKPQSPTKNEERRTKNGKAGVTK